MENWQFLLVLQDFGVQIETKRVRFIFYSIDNFLMKTVKNWREENFPKKIEKLKQIRIAKNIRELIFQEFEY